MPDSSKVLKNILHYQKSIDRYSQDKNDTKILHCIFKLFNMHVTVSHLEKTGIGRTVNSLRKLGGEVGDAAKTLVTKWKQMVSHNDDYEKSTDSIDETGTNYQLQRSKNEDESNSSHKYSDTYKNDQKEKSNKDKHKNNKEKHNEYNNLNCSESKYEPTSIKNNSADNNVQSCEFDNELHSTSNYSSESEHSSCTEKVDLVQQLKKNIYEDQKYSDKYKKNRDSFSESSSKPKQGLDKERKGERLHLREKVRKVESYLDYAKKQKQCSSNFCDSNELELKQNNSSSIIKQSTKRKYNLDASDEEIVRKIAKKSSQDCYYSSNSSPKSRENNNEYKKEKRYELDCETSAQESHKSSNHKHKESSYQDHKKEKRSSMDKKEPTSTSKTDLKSDKKKHDSYKEKRSKFEETTSKQINAKEVKKSNTKDKSKSKHTSKSNSSSSVSKKNSDIPLDIGSESGTSFAEALGMLEPATSKINTKKLKISDTHQKVDKGLADREKFPVEKSTKSDKIDIVIPLPPPNYRPIVNLPLENYNSRSKVANDDETLSLVMAQKNQRTKVYSGNKSFYGTVPTLFELCLRILQDNIDALEYTGGVPYIILKPVLDKATPDQLFMLEHHNPYLIEDSDEIWQFHCQKEFRNKQREELESWREMYLRCLDEREAKLKALTENIKLAQDKSIPVRQTKLAYVDSVVKPPRDVLRKQAKNGIDKKPICTPSSRLTLLATSGAASQISVPNPSRASSSGNASVAVKPKKAPLMQKTLAFLKGSRFRR